MGDVPASMLSLGTPEQVADYCRKLIDIVGKDGGFILSTGCDLPQETPIDNIDALMKAGREYEVNH